MTILLSDPRGGRDRNGDINALASSRTFTLVLGLI